MTCHNPVPGYGEMDQMVSQRETDNVGVGMVKKKQTEAKLLSIALHPLGTRGKWRGSLRNRSLFSDPSTTGKAGKKESTRRAWNTKDDSSFSLCQGDSPKGPTKQHICLSYSFKDRFSCGTVLHPPIQLGSPPVALMLQLRGGRI